MVGSGYTIRSVIHSQRPRCGPDTRKRVVTMRHLCHTPPRCVAGPFAPAPRPRAATRRLPSLRARTRTTGAAGGACAAQIPVRQPASRTPSPARSGAARHPSRPAAGRSTLSSLASMEGGRDSAAVPADCWTSTPPRGAQRRAARLATVRAEGSHRRAPFRRRPRTRSQTAEASRGSALAPSRLRLAGWRMPRRHQSRSTVLARCEAMSIVKRRRASVAGDRELHGPRSERMVLCTLLRRMAAEASSTPTCRKAAEGRADRPARRRSRVRPLAPPPRADRAKPPQHTCTTTHSAVRHAASERPG